jgi:ankyrin repeat protein
LDAGAQVNLTDSDGGTPLIESSKMGHADVVKLLLYRGADVSAKDKDNETAFSYATQNDLKEITEILIKHGAQ